MFNIWRDRVRDCRWLDLCAGVGAMGAEALGRGATTVVGVEQSKQACQVIRHNWGRIASDRQTFRVIRGDVRRALGGVSREAPFDCIYFDPPYAGGLYLSVLEQVDRLELLAEDGELVAEHGRESEDLPEVVGRLRRRDRRSYGNTTLSFYGFDVG